MKNPKTLAPDADFNPVGLPARTAAVDLLSDVLDKQEPLDEAFGRYGDRGILQGLAHRDRAFARAIVATTLRRRGQIQDVLNRFLSKPLPRRSGKLRHILAAATAQILFLETPAHAVINLAVHQTRQDRRARHFDRLVNAVLRRVSHEGTAIVATQDAARLNTPDWLWERWRHNHGARATRAIAKAHLQEAALDLTVKDDPARWASELGGKMLPTGTVRIAHKGRIEKIVGYKDGTWWVQDAGAALMVPLLGEIKHARVADLCAAPGGKTAQLAHAGAHVWAVDASKTRLERLRENLDRLQLKAEIIQADATDWQPDVLFDAVLLDAPCSATGTIRRHPDLPHLKSAQDITALSEIQCSLLHKAPDFLKPGGLLVYCTCSLEPEEGPKQISQVLKSRKDIQRNPISVAELHGQADWITKKGMLLE